MKDTNYMDLFERRMERESLSAEEQLAILQDLGLAISEDAAANAIPEGEFVPILEAAGWGVYDYDNRIWTPSSEQIYAFDAEVFDIEGMYCNYLKGLQAISEKELTFTDVVQDNSKVCWEEPSGSVCVQFCLNGIECRCEVDFQGDWLDVKIQDAVNHYLEELGINKRFYCTDASQGNIVFFCTEEWARRFEEATLCFMSSSGSI